MKLLLLIVILLLLVAACTTTSEIIIDDKGVDMTRYEENLAECRIYSEQVAVGKKATKLLEEEGETRVVTNFRVVGAMSPVELSETTLNRPLLDTIAELSGGRVVSPDESGQLAGLFLTGDETREELRETRLWDHWLLLLLFCGLLTSEWVIRRGSGLP